MTKLSDTQLVFLSAASQRADGLLNIHNRRDGAAAEKLGEKLLRLGFVEEIAIGRDQPVWRVSDDDGARGLKITHTGLAALGLEEGQQPIEATAALPKHVAFSSGKTGLVVDLLRRETGASITELMEATGWLPHSTRAALTGLRRKGHEITRTRSEAGLAIYRIVPVTPAADGRV